MSVLIRGMRFPKTCDECLINCGRSMLYIGITDRRSPNCPLVEIPTPHGRLADLDQIIEGYWDGSAMRIDETDLKAIEKYDVVIEAEGEKDGR